MLRARPTSLLLALLACAALPGAGVRADEPKPEGKEPPKAEGKDKEAPPSVAAEKGPFAIVVEAAGVLEPVGAADVSYDPDAWNGDLVVVESVPAGPVEKDQVLVRFDTEKIDEQVQAAERDLEIAKRNLSRQQEEAQRAQEGAEVALAREREEKDHADRALAWFLETDRALRLKESELRLQGGRDNLQDQEEELAQLEKMYKADDVVEPTEDIVMKRARRQLERSRASFGVQQTRAKNFVDVELPQEERGLRLNARKETLELARLEATTPIGLEQSRLELAKAVAGLERQGQALARLRKDREAMVVKAPRAGWAVPGTCARGKWGALEETARALEKGGKARPNQTLYTIVEPGAVAVRTAVPEASVLQVRTGQTAQVVPAADPAKTLAGTVARVARVSSDGNYEVVLDVAEKDARLMPGFTVKVRLRTVDRPDAVTVPAGCVVADGDRRVVHVVAPDGTSAPREVKTGATSQGRTEILDGLQAGERVLKSPPKN